MEKADFQSSLLFGRYSNSLIPVSHKSVLTARLQPGGQRSFFLITKWELTVKPNQRPELSIVYPGSFDLSSRRGTFLQIFSTIFDKCRLPVYNSTSPNGPRWYYGHLGALGRNGG